MKKNYVDFIVTVLISAGIGLVIAFAEIVIKHFSAEIVFILIRDMVIGIVIGSLSQLSFIYIFSIKQKPSRYAFITVFILIATISSIPFIYGYLTHSKSSVILLVAIICIAESLGMTLCYFSFKKSLKYSRKLHEKKQALRQNQ